jgi:hypothetical protein
VSSCSSLFELIPDGNNNNGIMHVSRLLPLLCRFSVRMSNWNLWMDSSDHYALSYEESFNQIRHGHFWNFFHNQIWEVLHNPTMLCVWWCCSEVLSSLLTTVNFNLLERAIAAAWQLRVLFSLVHISLWTQYVDHRSSSQSYWNLQVFYNERVSIMNKCVTICKQRVKMWIGIEIVQLNGSAILW